MTSSQAFGAAPVPGLGRSHGRVPVPPCCSHSRFPEDVGRGASFRVLVCPPSVFFGEVSVEVFGPFFNWVVGFPAVEFEELFV